jgi:hypothetical protein
LWLGHAHIQTTEIYTRIDPSIKLEALDAVTPTVTARRAFPGERQIDRLADEPLILYAVSNAIISTEVRASWTGGPHNNIGRIIRDLRDLVVFAGIHRGR